jgi:uncharacterized SAM-binding protein YcdF (DUF218 family)
LIESTSLDTIGNAYFSRITHIDPLHLTRLLVVTSDFHLARVRTIFEWVYGLSGGFHELTFEGVPNIGINRKSLEASRRKEQKALLDLRAPINHITTLDQLHQWIFFGHDAYRLIAKRSAIENAIYTY